MAVPGMQGLDTLYKPWGMTAGGMVGRRETDMEAADLLNLEEGMLSNVIKQVEASRAANDFSDPRMEALRQQGIMGDNMTKSAQGQTAMGTLETGISSKNAKNRADQSSSQIDNMINTLDSSIAMMQANGPAGVAMVMSQLPPELQQVVQQAGPQGPAVLSKLSEMLKQQRSQTPKHLGDMEMEGFKQEGTFITEDMKQQAADKRNRDDNAARYADMTQRREDSKNTKASADGMRREAELTRRMEHGRGKLKLLQDEFTQVDEAINTPVFGLTKEEKAARKVRLEKQKKDIQQSAREIATELERLGSLSTFASGEGTAAKPIKLD